MVNRHIERYSTSLVIREMQIHSEIPLHTSIAKMKYTITSVGNGVEKLELSYISGRNVK